MRKVFAPSRVQFDPVYCACCGNSGQASAKIETETHISYFLPDDWTVLMGEYAAHQADGLARCNQCTWEGETETFYKNTHQVFVQPNHGTRPSVRFERKKIKSSAPESVPVHEPITARETDMPQDEESKSKEQLKELGSAFALAGELGIVNEGGEIMLDIAKEITKDVPLVPMILEHPDGRELAKIGTAITLQSLAIHTKLIPKSHLVRRIASRQIAASGFLLIKDRLRSVGKYLEQLAGLGEKLTDVDPAQLTEGMTLGAAMEEEAAGADR